MVKTFKELQAIDQMIGFLYEQDQKLKNTKFGYAYQKFFKKNYEPALKEFQNKIFDIRLDNAMEDKITKEVLKDKDSPRGFKFTKEGLKKCVEQERSLIEEFDKKEIEVTPQFSSYVPELTEEQKELLTGLIIE